MATPFVQGHLNEKTNVFEIHTECAHSGESIHIEMDRHLGFRVVPPAQRPLHFIPMVNFAKLRAESIIDDF